MGIVVRVLLLASVVAAPARASADRQAASASVQAAGIFAPGRVLFMPVRHEKSGVRCLAYEIEGGGARPWLVSREPRFYRLQDKRYRLAVRNDQVTLVGPRVTFIEGDSTSYTCANPYKVIRTTEDRIEVLRGFSHGEPTQWWFLSREACQQHATLEHAARYCGREL